MCLVGLCMFFVDAMILLSVDVDGILLLPRNTTPPFTRGEY